MTDRVAGAVMLLTTLAAVGAGCIAFGATGSVAIGFGTISLSWPVFLVSLAAVYRVSNKRN